MNDATDRSWAPGVALGGLGRERSPRQLIGWASQAGFRSVALDGTAPGARARELDRSARRELAALLRRSELRFAGVDLWIPSSHFSHVEHQDRALSATIDAIDLTAEIGRLNGEGRSIVSVTLPDDGADEMVDRILDAVMAASVQIADHQWPPAQRSDEAQSTLGVGVDPATLLLAGADPVEQLLELDQRLACVRLSDADQAGRTPLGEGRLDVQAYTAALRAGRYAKSALVDMRGVANPLVAATLALGMRH